MSHPVWYSDWNYYVGLVGGLSGYCLGSWILRRR